MLKIFYDLETTGTEKSKHSIHQLAGLVEVDEVVVESFDFRMRPHPRALIEPIALRKCGVDIEQIMAYPTAAEVHPQLLAMLDKYVDKYDPKSKAFLVGFNNRWFDDPFFRKHFELQKDDFFNAWFWGDTLDALVLASEYLQDRRVGMPSFKLHRVATELGLAVDHKRTHEADYDVQLTRGIYRIVTGRQFEI